MACKATPQDVNAYAKGNCTWWAKKQAPWVPEFWGNAAEWLTMAQQCGFKTGKRAAKGAVAVWGPGVDPPFGYGHVGVVTDVRGDGSFVVTEMNWQGLGKVDKRNVDPQDPNLQGFIYAPGSASPGPSLPDPSVIATAISGAGDKFVAAGQLAAGGFVLLVALALGVWMVMPADVKQDIKGAARKAAKTGVAVAAVPK